MNERLESNHCPYLPLKLHVQQLIVVVEGLLDTGFDGDVSVPAALRQDLEPSDSEVVCGLADGTVVSVPVYEGEVRLGVLDRFGVYFDHGQRVIVEP